MASGAQVSQKQSEVAALAMICVARFVDLYVFNTTAYQGVDVDVTLTDAPTFTPFWDEQNMATGVTVAFTIQDNLNDPCFTAYFA